MGAVRTIQAKIADFNSQHIAVSLWAIAKLGFNPGREFLDIGAGRCTELVGEYNPQNIANSLWAFATLGETPGNKLLETMAARSLSQMKVLRPRDESVFRPTACLWVWLEESPISRLFLPMPKKFAAQFDYILLASALQKMALVHRKVEVLLIVVG